MPVGTASVESIKCKLDKLPDAYVELRKLSYGEKLKSQELISRMHTQTGAEGGTFEFGFEASNFYEFSKSIINHNLTDTDGRPLNFNNREDFVRLDPAVGEEIGTLINELNAGTDMAPFLVTPTKLSVIENESQPG